MNLWIYEFDEIIYYKYNNDNNEKTIVNMKYAVNYNKSLFHIFFLLFWRIDFISNIAI